jgi:hypothetical protein
VTRPPRRHRAWPTAKQAEAYAKHSHIRPIVPFAKFVVDCVCGAALDSAAATADDAVAEIAKRHKCKHTRASEAPKDGDDPPLRSVFLDAELRPRASPLTATAYGDLT